MHIFLFCVKITIGDIMNDSKYKFKRLTYIAIGFLILILGVLLLILGFTINSNIDKVIIAIAIVLLVSVIPYYFLAVLLINSLKNKYKELLISDAFTSRDFLYYSRQKFLKENKIKYIITRNEFENLNYYRANDTLNFVANELVVGSIRDIQFRSMDYKYLTEKLNTKKCGRIYSLNLKSDNAFRLVITKDNYTSLNKINLKINNYNVYTNNNDLANKYILVDNFSENISKIEAYGNIFIEINNGSLYLIIDGINKSFDVENNRNYNDITEDVEREIYIINTIINSFKFEAPKPKIRQLKIK